MIDKLNEEELIGEIALIETTLFANVTGGLSGCPNPYCTSGGKCSVNQGWTDYCGG